MSQYGYWWEDVQSIPFIAAGGETKSTSSGKLCSVNTSNSDYQMSNYDNIWVIMAKILNTKRDPLNTKRHIACELLTFQMRAKVV